MPPTDPSASPGDAANSKNTPDEDVDSKSKELVLYAATGRKDRIRPLLDAGADPMYCNGMPMMVAAAGGHDLITAILLCAGGYKKHPGVLRFAANIAFAKGDKDQAEYMDMWADIYEQRIQQDKIRVFFQV